MTLSDIEKLRELSAKATPGEWRNTGPSSGQIRGVDDGGDYAILAGDEIIAEAIHRTGPSTYQPSGANADLICALRNALPELLDMEKDAGRWRYINRDDQYSNADIDAAIDAEIGKEGK